MSSQTYRSAWRSLRSLLAAPRSFSFVSGKAAAAATATSFRRNMPSISSFQEQAWKLNLLRGMHAHEIAEIISCFERKSYKLVAIKRVVPSKEFAQEHYHNLKERPFFNGLCLGQCLPCKLIGATDPQKSEPGTIRGDLAVMVGRNIIHGSDGPETAKDEIKLWFKPCELVSYSSNAEK